MTLMTPDGHLKSTCANQNENWTDLTVVSFFHTPLDGSTLIGRSGDSPLLAPRRTATSGCCIALGGALTQRNIQCNPGVITVVS